MPFLPFPPRLLTLALLISVASLRAARCGDEISFSADVRPILAANCYACHGPDEETRQADLRLDDRAEAIAFGAIAPHHPDESELIRRIDAENPEERMPPADSGRSLSSGDRDTLRRWVAAGAPYERHWAFVPPQRPSLPHVASTVWPRNGIDRFVLARLEAEQLEPSPPADRFTLIRRVYLDLIGLPPTPEEADAFAADQHPQAYEKLVDRLLQSRHYGERWARAWLDLARYADTNGYEKDRPRSIWPYRDWVIRALNADLPYDQFTIEQLAGDMLPNATVAQRIATGFHRNTMLNEEGGIDPLEYRFYSMVDRVATTSTVWLGLTAGCAQCHTHKYDPISHTEYYELLGLLNNADEPDLTLLPEPIQQRREDIDRQIAEREAELPYQFPTGQAGAKRGARLEAFEAAFQAWLSAAEAESVAWRTIRPSRLQTNLPTLAVQDDGSIFSTGDITKRDVFDLTFRLDGGEPITALRLEALPDQRLPSGGPGRCYYEGRQGDFFLSEITARFGGQPISFRSASHSYGKLAVGSGNADAANVLDGDGSTGWSTAEREGEAHYLILNLAELLEAAGDLEIRLLFERHFAASLGRFRFSAAAPREALQARAWPLELEELLARTDRPRSRGDLDELRRHFARLAPELKEHRRPIDELRRQRPQLPTTLVMHERLPGSERPTFRHHRGEFLSPREKVQPGIPQILRAPDASAPANRLEFARWLVSDANPLVGRVTVNRAWQAIFGTGLVQTSGDFGSQGARPSHPMLLDWLAVELRDQSWSLKELHRLIVTSATYRQASLVTPAAPARDPDNRLLGRFPRQRLEGELIRDVMLRASGLLNTKMYGPSVYPPQPPSVTELAYGATPWNPSQGDDRYRRSLYTFSKRTTPFAAYAVFDAPTGESCIPRRNRSNTPLQALTLLNDEMFLELARGLAELAAGEAAPPEIATMVFRRVLTRPPTDLELKSLLEFQQAQRARCRAGELDPAQITGNAAATPEQAAWVMLSRAIMNLDEAVTKP